MDKKVVSVLWKASEVSPNKREMCENLLGQRAVAHGVFYSHIHCMMQSPLSVTKN